MSSTNTSFASLTTSFTTSTSEFICSTCQKRFKKQSGLSRHLNIVKKYNIPRNDLDNLSETNNEKFRSILVYLINRKLPHGFKKGGRQLVSLACTEHQFFNIFKGHIYHHHSNRNVYKCVFQGSSGYQILSEILNNPLWGQKFYDNEQQTYVVLFSDPLQHLKNNLLAIATRCITEGVNTKRRKSNYNPGEVVVEWKIKGERDAKENYCEAGFIYIRFWVKQI
ncbi:hypothetical protein GLOIN_2v1824366 [Rhizophagus irregularis DAOM 181602=DAOM 197198]|uniref:C2H2-type domain-containing protein n=1 Tax=Rhizophagus irregularis (strain DAOM 181602 / DAOM 197198 / MUCL 43194) TaxID=747089 RepID=A0A2P4NX23_RHIID|nr:hypothetical protein GLOIN_2v1824366 [Rhizophagus irregularis DAOM 181602=DAOM 197198]POG57686.1 hypothetical protein GLOIN_2v1824366 [Rhizophagus irregularis DAOM 181602=DAOM 197198]|eukprot:XP_025164552.1 hypothetical protein GLOIN_2v1824366 [Rhizophagus irregularis DAOM 181602=DAOM 197198]